MSVQIDGSVGIIFPDSSVLTSATPKSTGIVGGAANQILVQTGPNVSGFIAAPTVASTVLTWNGSAFTWTAGGGGGGSGTVTSIDVSGGTTGLTTSGGPVTTSGTITLAGTLNVANGGTGATTLTGYVKGNGTAAMTASATVPTTDLSGTITNAQLANSTISGVSLGSNLATLTIGTGLSGTSYNGSSAATIALPSQSIGTGTVGSSTSIPVITYNDQGIITAVSSALTVDLSYQGTWNATTNTPTLANGTGTQGDYYVCNVAGTVNFGAGPLTFNIGDWAIYNGTIWEQVNNSQTTSVANFTITGIGANEIILGGGSLPLSGLGYGTAGQVLTSGGAGLAPSWSTNISGNAATATLATKSTNIAGGVQYQIPVQTAADTTSYIAAPTVNGTVLSWSAGTFSWVSVSGGGGTVTSVDGSGGTTGLTLTGGPITTNGTLTLGGILNPANGGTGVANNFTLTITGANRTLDQNVSSGSAPTFTGTNFTGVPISTGVSGLGANVATFLATPSSANLASAMTDETGSGLLVFNTDPSISNLTIDGASPWINMTPIAPPAYAEGRVFYDTNAKTLAYYNDNSQMTVNIAQEQIIRVRNQTGAIVPNGTVVYINGASANAPTIALAQANTFNTSDIIGVTTTDINNNGFGYVTVAGIVNGLNTTGFTAGDRVFVSPTTPGAYTTTEPVAPNYAVQVGVITVVDGTNGALLVATQLISVETQHVVGTLGISQGGTGQTTASAAFNALSPITTTGDLIIGNGANSATRLGIGTSGYVLTSNGTTASWAAPATSGTVTSIDVSGGTTGLTTSGGPITGSGTITLGGTLGVANGGTGATTLTGYVKGSGTAALTASATIPTTDLSGTITNAQLANSTISGIALGGNLATLTIGTGLSGTSYNGSTATTIALTNTTVTAGSYGSSTQIPVITVDAQGRITAATTAATIDLSYQGTWNAATNTPTLANGTGTQGDYYVCNVAGTANFGAGPLVFNIGDWAIYNGTIWELVNNSQTTSVANFTITGIGANQLILGGGSSPLSGLGYGTAGQMLVSGGAGNAPTWAAAATGTVTSVDVSGGTTGLTTSGGPITGSGTITLAGTLNVANGGTGATTLTGYVKGSGTSALTASATIPTTDLSGTITNAQLANSSVTVNGTSIALGSSGTITANTTNALTIGTGLSGTSFNGSAAVTVAIANTTVTAASYGSASSVGTFTVNAQGQLTAAADVAISIANTQVTGLGTMSTQNATSVAITGGTINGAVIGGTTPAAITGTTITATQYVGVSGGTF